MTFRRIWNTIFIVTIASHVKEFANRLQGIHP